MTLGESDIQSLIIIEFSVIRIEGGKEEQGEKENKPTGHLNNTSNFGFPKRQAAGTDLNRMNLLIAVLEKRLGLQIGASDAYVNIAGGMKIQEPALDLGIVLALVSSHKNRPLDDKIVVFGEVGLSGEVRAVSMAAQRVGEAKKLGFTACILPAACTEGLQEEIWVDWPACLGQRVSKSPKLRPRCGFHAQHCCVPVVKWGLWPSS